MYDKCNYRVIWWEDQMQLIFSVYRHETDCSLTNVRQETDYFFTKLQQETDYLWTNFFDDLSTRTDYFLTNLGQETDYFLTSFWLKFDKYLVKILSTLRQSKISHFLVILTSIGQCSGSSFFSVQRNVSTCELVFLSGFTQTAAVWGSMKIYSPNLQNLLPT